MAPVPLAVSADTLTLIVMLVPAVIVAAAYARRARTLAGRGRPVPRWRQWCFYAGTLTVIGAVSGLGPLSQELLWVHMVEHLLIGDIGALLIVLGLTAPLIAPILNFRIGSARPFFQLRWLAHPLVAFPLWAIDLYVWHLPVLYEAALRHGWLHALQHGMFLFFGINMWMCLFGPLPMPEWFGNLGRLFYIVAVRLTGGVLGNIFLWSGTVFYPYYLKGDIAYNVSPLADQNIAGAIMMVEESMLTLGLFCWLFLRAARESDERQRLLDLARANGVELSERRAARAVAAGRAGELRRRVEASAAHGGPAPVPLQGNAAQAAPAPLQGGTAQAAAPVQGSAAHPQA